MTKLEKSRKFLTRVRKLAKTYDLDFFCVTDGASAYSMRNTDKDSAIVHARQCQIKWEQDHGFDPDEDWSKTNEQEKIRKS